MNRTKEWLTASEVAGLPGMPGTERGVNKAGDRGDITRRKREFGKGWEYHIDSLPVETRNHLAAKESAAAINERVMAERLAQAQADGEAFGRAEREKEEAAALERRKTREQGLARWASLPDGERKERANARLWVLKRLWEFRRNQKGSKAATRAAFCEAINQGAVTHPDWVGPHIPRYEHRRALTAATLERWELDYDRHGIGGLLDGYGNRKGTSKIEADPERRKLVLGAMLQQPHITPKKVHDYLAAKGLNGMSVQTVARFMEGWKQQNAQIWTYMTNPDKWKNVYLASHGDHFATITALNQLWELDSTPADWMLTDGRHTVIGCLDLYSRRLRFLVSPTSKAASVCKLVRSAILSWGVPQGVRTDNGADYVSEQLGCVLRDLDISHLVCVPFASEDKGAIERAIKTLLHGILDLLPGFIGHNVAERKVIEARASFAKRVMTPGEVVEVSLSAQELQRKIDEWCEVYMAEPHGGLDGRTPHELVGSWTQPIRTITDERAMDVLLMPIAGRRTVSKKGILFEHHHYIHPRLTTIVGQDVDLKQDENLSRLYVYDAAGKFVCVAEAPDLAGITRAEWAAAAQHHQRRFIQQQAEDLRRVKRSLKENIGEAVLTHKLEAARKLAHFPGQSTSYTTDALDQAGIAARTFDAPEIREQTAEQRAAQEALERELAAPVVHELPETERRRFHRWVRLSRRASTGVPLQQDEAEFLWRYAQTPEWRAQRMVHVDGGLMVDDQAVDAEEKGPLPRAQHNNNVEKQI